MHLFFKYTLILSLVWLSQHERILSAQNDVQEESTVFKNILRDDFEFPNHSFLVNLRHSLPPLRDLPEITSADSFNLSDIYTKDYIISSEKIFQRNKMITNILTSTVSQGGSIVSSSSPLGGVVVGIGTVSFETAVNQSVESYDQIRATALLNATQKGYVQPQSFNNDEFILLSRYNSGVLLNYERINILDKKMISLEQENRSQDERMKDVTAKLSKQISKLEDTGKELSSKQNSLRKRINDTHKKLEATSGVAQDALHLAHENKKI